jgi:hypothetical protein
MKNFILLTVILGSLSLSAIAANAKQECLDDGGSWVWDINGTGNASKAVWGCRKSASGVADLAIPSTPKKPNLKAKK